MLKKVQTQIDFSSIGSANQDDLVAIGGNLSIKSLISAYRLGIFPWYNSDEESILWWSPNPRCVLYPADIKISRSLAKTLRHSGFNYTLDHCFDAVIRACAQSNPNRPDTWITNNMIGAYCQLHKLGIAHSIEVWQHDQLVGGLYGLAQGGIFFGESMFSRSRDASKAALVILTRTLQSWQFKLIDCQTTSAHLLSLGALAITRKQFQRLLIQGLKLAGKPGSWKYGRL